MHLRIIARLKLYEYYAYFSPRIQQRLFPRSQNSLGTDAAAQLPEFEIKRREVSEQSIRAFHAHRPEVFSGRIVLVRATDLRDGMWCTDPSYGWSSICKGGVDVISMGCQHVDFLKEPHVTDLAGHINELLNAIDT